MEGWRSFQNTQVHGYQTSVDLARQQTFSVPIRAGQKRSYSTAEEPFIDTVPADVHRREPLPKNKLDASRIIGTDIQTTQDAGNVSEYSQRKAAPSTPGISQDPLLSLAHPAYQLPRSLVSNFASLGVSLIYPWQKKCLTQRTLLRGKQNFIYTAPTGGGKSLVADVLLLKKIISNPTKKAILVLPYVALVQEKLKWFRRLVDGVAKNIDPTDPLDPPLPSWKQPHLSTRVAGFFGGSKAKASWADTDIAVCTIEKANALVNCAIEEGQIDQLGVMVVDELHMIDDEHRGYLIELMLMKLMCLQNGCQIIGMSATLSNVQLIADWIQAKYYISTYRPVPVEEFLVYGNAVYPTVNSKEFFRTASQLSSPALTQKPPEASRRIEKSLYEEFDNPMVNSVVSLALETAQAGYGALVFCSSRRGSETMANLISEATPTGTIDSVTLDARMELLAALQALPGGFEPAFQQTILRGVGIHHAGLTTEEREIVADAYDKGVLKVMVATCSLAAGINLPARRVILNGVRMGRDLVGPAMLRQMRGRAGRKGKDELGESYVCCQRADLEAVAELLEAELPPVKSSLTPEKRGMNRALLEVIATKLATTEQSLDDYIRRSLLYRTVDQTLVHEMLFTAIQELISTKLIEVTDFGSYEATRLGQAILASSLTPEDGIFVHDEIQKSLQSLVMDGEIHVFYLFTPPQMTGVAEVTWQVFCDQMERLDDSGLRAIRCIGINPTTVHRLAQGGVMKEETPEGIVRARIYRRVYSAFQLRDLCNEVPIHEISLRYRVPRGSVQNLAQSCHGFAAGMIRFCERMGWGMLAAVLDHMLDRLRAGARADLLEMAQVTYVKSRMARILWENGLQSVRALSEADPKDLVPIMMQAQGRKLRVRGEAAEKLKAKLLEKAQVIVSSASRLWERQQLMELEE